MFELDMMRGERKEGSRTKASRVVRPNLNNRGSSLTLRKQTSTAKPQWKGVLVICHVASAGRLSFLCNWCAT